MCGVLVILVLLNVLAGLVLGKGAGFGGRAKGSLRLLREVAVKEGVLLRGVEEVLSWLTCGGCCGLGVLWEGLIPWLREVLISHHALLYVGVKGLGVNLS